jgi:hypothetical protein
MIPPRSSPSRRQVISPAVMALLMLGCAAPQTVPSPMARTEPPKRAPSAGEGTTETRPSDPQAVPAPPATTTANLQPAGIAPTTGAPALASPRSDLPVTSGPGWSIITTAPEGITSADLGRVFDASFQPLAGSGGLFRPKSPESYPIFRHSVSLVEDRITLAATVRSWGLNADAGRSRRFASYRAEQITEIHAVDDMAPPQAAPPTAMYYLAKVFYGRSFEVRLSAEEKQFHSGIAGTFLSGKLDGGLKSFAEKNRLEFTAVGRGLRPKSGNAIYAKQPSEIEENYTVDGSISVPVEVEYRLIPGREIPKVEPIAWRKQARYRVELSAVEAHHCDATSACDLDVTVSQVDGSDKAKIYHGPADTDLWEPRYLLLETTEEADLLHGFEFAVADRNLTVSKQLGRCQVRVDQNRLKAVNESPDRRLRWTELCGKSQVRLTVISEDAN